MSVENSCNPWNVLEESVEKELIAISFFEKIYRENYQKCISYARNRVDSAYAEEIVAEVFCWPGQRFIKMVTL